MWVIFLIALQNQKPLGLLLRQGGAGLHFTDTGMQEQVSESYKLSNYSIASDLILYET